MTYPSARQACQLLTPARISRISVAMSSYVPPWRRGQADGGASPGPSAAGGPSAFPAASSSSHNRPYNNNNGNDNGNGNRGRGRGWPRGGGRGFRGGRGSYGGRGGGGGYQGQNPTQGPHIDEADLFQRHDIENHFSPGDQASSVGKGSTFHDSTAHPRQLSYILLYPGANPRWSNDQIVFAKSRLPLLPEYAAKLLEHGPWDIPATARKARAGSIDNPQEADETAGGGETSTNEAANSTVDVAQDKEVEHANDPDGPLPSTQASQEPSSTSIGKEKTQGSPVRSAEAESVDVATSAPTPTPVSLASSRMKYTDVRNIPPEELYKDQEEEREEELVYPSIQPIDYIPATHPAVAVFVGHRTGPLRGGTEHFYFDGWHKVARVNLLAPHSAELLRMQQQKWERRDRYGRVLPSRPRDVAAWKAAMGNNWAVVKFEKLDTEAAPPPPIIERVPKPQPQPNPDGNGNGEAEPSRGVNEMLTELRFGGDAVGGDKGGSTTTPPDGNGEASKAEPEASEEQEGGAPEDGAQDPVAVEGKDGTTATTTWQPLSLT
ncbi:hypothetical protein SLS62_001387 [Diatrype stigma]|uniref:Uncharacterized protein n=1 Tax=Diatrype stigma TaxID=117547 RepID=A0AAN9UZ33_9PEZI